MKKLSIFLLTLSLLWALSLVVSASDLLVLEKIKISGNNKVKEQVILDLLPFQVGDQLTKEEWDEKADLATKLLKKEGLFFNVNVFPFYSEDGKTCKILVEISGEWTYQFGGWIYPPFIMVEDRAFLGNSDTLGVKLSTFQQELYFVDRHSLKLPVDLGIRVYNQSRVVSRILGYTEKFYARKGYGGKLTGSYHVTDSQQIDLGLGYAKDRMVTNFENPILDTELGFFEQDQVNLTVGYLLQGRSSLSYDGYTLRVMGSGTKVLNSDLMYSKAVVDFRLYQKLFAGLKGAVNIGYGLGTANMPYYQKFNLNNATGVRGKQAIIPGDQEFFVKSELIYPVIFGIEAVAFMDLGNSWNREQGINWDNTGMGYGLGLRYRAGMPINTTFRLEAAFSENGQSILFVTGESF